MWIVDSSVYIDWMRQGRSPTRILRPFVLADQMFTCGVIRVEVLRGAVKPAVRTELGELFNALRDIPFTAGVWDRTEALAWQLDWAGTVLPLSDLMIAACALHVGATVVSTDPHYGQVPGLTVRGTLPAMSFG
jgi:predicted nucleic acid-binding protein